MASRTSKTPPIYVSSKENNYQQVSPDQCFIKPLDSSSEYIKPLPSNSLHTQSSTSNPTKPLPSPWSLPLDLIDKINELNSLKDVNRPLPSLPPTGNTYQADGNGRLQVLSVGNTERSQDISSTSSVSPNTSLRVLVPRLRQDKMMFAQEGYSSNEEWVPPESQQSKRIETCGTYPAFGSQTISSSHNDLINITPITYNESKANENLSMIPVKGPQSKPLPSELPLQSTWLASKTTSSVSQSQSYLNLPLQIPADQPVQNEVPSFRNTSALPDTQPTTTEPQNLASNRTNHRIVSTRGSASPPKHYEGIPSLNPDRGGMARDKSAPNLRTSPENIPMINHDSNATGRRSASPSLSPMGYRKFQSLSNKGLFRMNSRESLNVSSRLSANHNTSLNFPHGTPEKNILLNMSTQGRLSMSQLDTNEGQGYAKHDSTLSSQQQSTMIPTGGSQKETSPLINQLSPILPVQQSAGDTPLLTHYIRESERISRAAAKDQMSSERGSRVKVLTFNGGPFFPPTYTKDQKVPLVLTETGIISRFRELEEDIRPHFESVVTTLTPTLQLDRPRNSIIKGSYNSKITPFDSIHSYPGAQVFGRSMKPPDEESPLQFKSLVENQLSEKFRLLHSLPFFDPYGSKGEFYVVANKEDQSILLLKVLYRGELGSQEPGMVILLMFKVGDSTLTQLIDAQTMSHGRFKITELRSLLHDCVTSLYTLQKEGNSLSPLHPDLILFDQDNQVFYVLPVGYPSNYDPKNPNARLFSLRKHSEAKSHMSQHQTSVQGHPNYMSPVLRQIYDKGMRECLHNPYKSCMFSLGLILLEAITLQTVDGLNQSKQNLYEKICKNPLYVTSSIVGKDYLIHCPNILRILLNYEEDERPDFILLYFRLFTDLPVFEDPLHPKMSPPILDNQIINQLQISKKLGSLKVTLSFARGHKYVGQVNEFNGQVIRHGHGSFYNEHGDLVFQGIWDQDFPKEGTFIYSEEYKYEGKWGGFFHDGHGILYYKSFPLYEGGWQSFKYHGKGKLYHENGLVKYEGDFKLSMKHGQGKTYYPNGNIYHVGSYKEDKMHGQGTLYWPTGDLKFEGEILCDGMGALYLKGTHYGEEDAGKANIYVGELHHDQYHGEGTLYDSQGNVLASGEWLYGQLKSAPTLSTIKDNSFESFSTMKEKDERTYGLKLNCVLETSNISQDLKEMELYLDFHSEKEELSLDMSDIEMPHLEVVFNIMGNNPYFRDIKSIVLSKFFDPKYASELKPFLQGPNISNLRSLSTVKAIQFSDTMCKLLSEAPCANSLKEISLIDSGCFSEEGLEYLLNSKSLGSLNILRIKNPICVKDRLVQNCLLNAFPLRNLTKLSLAQCHLNSEAIRVLFSINLVDNVRELNLSRNQIGNKGCQYIMESRCNLQYLTRISLKSCGIEAPGLSFLSRSECLANVRSINLSYNSVANAGCDFLFSSTVLVNLERIALKECNIGLQALKKISESRNVQNLKILELDHNKSIDNESIEYLADSNYLRNLEEISFVGATTTAKSVERLCRSDNLRNLRIIKIFGNELGKLVGKDIKKEMKIKKRIEII